MATHRAKGYMEWSPSPEVYDIIVKVREILREYSAYGAMTVRQIFYRLIGDHGYSKNQQSYKRLIEYLVKARRSGMIGFHNIRDDSVESSIRSGDNGRSEVWDYVQDLISKPDRYLHLDRNAGQPHHIELWCETTGMVPMLAQMVRYRDVSVYSAKGFSSITATHAIAKRVSERDKPTYFLHVGDYDPSGESIFTSMSQDVGAFVSSDIGGYYDSSTGAVQTDDEEPFFIPRRVALTEEQVEEFNLPTAPANPKDTRSNNWEGETTQAEAMDPPLLERVVRDALDELTDEDALAELLEKEKDEKERLRAAVEDQSVRDVLLDRFDQDDDPGLLELVQAIIDRDTEEE